jgi:signal recognition particle subunit SEC65
MNLKKWKTIYTTYFNKNLTVSEGRRLSLDKCVENPNVHLL